MFCAQCAGEIPAGSRFCPRCGRAAPGSEGAGAAGDRPPANPTVPPTSPGGLPPMPPTMPPPPPPPPPSYGAGAPPPSGGYSPPPPPSTPGGYPAPPPAYGAPPPYYGQAAGGGPVAYGLATFGQRAGALLIDTVIVTAVYVIGTIVAVATTPSSSFDNPNPGPTGVGILILIISWLAAAAYYPFFEGKPAGQTLGKKALGIRAVRKANGAPLGYGLAIGRFLARFADSFTFGLGLLWAAWDPDRQTFHDKIAGTLVVRSDVYPPPGIPSAAPGYQQPAPPPSPYQAN
jgi:uncharacterized RDD family membrane protein YckC